MALYRSPSGEVLDIPAKGAHAMGALGWVPVVVKQTAPRDPAVEDPKPVQRRRRKTDE